MSGKANNAGIYNFDNLNAQTLYIKGKRFEDYILELNLEDAFDLQQIQELKDILLYLNTSGLSTEWIVNNDNINADLKTAITALQTKLANIDTTALTQSSVLNNDNRNSVLKIGLDSVSNKTRFITEASVTGTGENTTSTYTTLVGPPSGEKGISIIELKQKNAPVGDLIGYKITSNFDDDDYDYNESIYSHPHGRTTMKASTIRIQATEQIRIGGFSEYGDSLGGAVNIGGRGGYVNIGAIDALTSGSPAQIQIGKQSDTAPNTSTRISGNVYLSDARFEDMTKSTSVTIGALAAFMAAGAPSWVLSFFSGNSLLPYSDVWCMKGGFAGTKNGSIETRNSIMLEELYVVNKAIVNITPKIGFWMAKADYSCTQLIGDHRTQTFEGDITIRNNNITSTSVDWALTGANDKCNVVNIGGNSGILIHQGASSNEEPLRIINSCKGMIEFRLTKDGTKSGGEGMSLRHLPGTLNTGMTSTFVRIGTYLGGGNGTSYGSYALEVNQYNGAAGQPETARDGMVVAKTIFAGATTTNLLNVINADSINTPGTITGINLVGSTSVTTNQATATSLVISGNYTGNTDARLYKNADNKLMWNGAEVGAGGASSGGITYMINVPTNLTNPNPTPTETIMTAAYSGNAQRTITQAVTANTAYYIAKYTTEVFDETSNPVLTGLQQLNQYLSWNSNSQTGQIYGRLWFQATAVAFATLYQRTYASPVTTTAATFINSTPIPTPKGLYNIKFQRVLFPNINVVVTSGPVVLRYRVEGYDLLNGWVTLATMTSIGQSVASSTNNLSVQLDHMIEINQTSSVGAKTALRLVLFIDSGTGTISQTSAGGADLAAYSLIGLGANTPGFFRTMLYDGTNAKIITPYSTTPTLIEYDMAIDAPYNISAFPLPTLSTDLYFIQPAGGFNNHAITLYFNEGSISHFHSSIAPTIATPTLAQVLNSGATASQPINMNANAITGITSLEGSSGGNWNVKEITAGNNIGRSVTDGNYTITNNAPVQDIGNTGTNIGVAIDTTTKTATISNTAPVQNIGNTGTNIGVAIDTTTKTATISNTAPVQNIVSGTGIQVSIDTTTKTATITNTNVGATQVGVAQSIRDEHLALGEVGALPRKPDYWATNWSVADSAVNTHNDIYVSVDGKVICVAGNNSLRYSTNYGSTWASGNFGGGNINWTSVCGNSQGSRLFAFGTNTAQGGAQSLLLFTSVGNDSISVPAGANWTQVTSAAFSGLTTAPRLRCSGDGTYLLASSENSTSAGVRGLVSSNGGATWAVKQIDSANTTLGLSFGVCMSRSGATQFIVWYSSAINSATGFPIASRIYRSLDYGVTWTIVSNQVGDDLGYSASWDKIECDATGRFLIATRVSTDSSQFPRMARSEDYGSNWIMVGGSGLLDIWVSGTGQYFAGIAKPYLGVSSVVNSNDYGRTYNFATSGTGIVHSCFGGSADGSILVMASRTSTGGDGLIRIARSGVVNPYDRLFAMDVVLWASGTQLTNSNYSHNIDWNTPIDLTQYSVKYELDVNWLYPNTTYGFVFMDLVLNQVSASSSVSQNSGAFPGCTNWDNIANVNTGSGSTFFQTYNGRFYCGFSTALDSTDQGYRQRSILRGELSLNGIGIAQTGLFFTDHSINSRLIYNKFDCESFYIKQGNGPTEWGVNIDNNPGRQEVKIHGSALFDASIGSLWTAESVNNFALFQGLRRMSLLLTDGGNGLRNRGSRINYRIWRVKK